MIQLNLLKGGRINAACVVGVRLSAQWKIFLSQEVFYIILLIYLFRLCWVFIATWVFFSGCSEQTTV